MNLSKFKNVKLKDWVLEKNSLKDYGYVGYTFRTCKKRKGDTLRLGWFHSDTELQSKTAAGLWKKIVKYLEGL